METRTVVADGHNVTVAFPQPCPNCQHHNSYEVVQIVQSKKGSEVHGVYRCAYQPCRSLFICVYAKSGSLLRILPKPVPEKAISPAVQKISPNFASIYREAEEALGIGLKQISGPGFRKAFEFLIKDYAKSIQPPEKAQDIEAQQAGAVIHNYITDARIQALAKRSLWLGNDETHYLRKWQDHDISDLIRLIDLTLHWIEIGEATKDVLADMPDGRS